MLRSRNSQPGIILLFTATQYAMALFGQLGVLRFPLYVLSTSRIELRIRGRPVIQGHG